LRENININFKIGDSVRVKDDVICPDKPDQPIGGWQGRIVDIWDGENNDNTVMIKWDSITLKNMPPSYIEDSIKEGLAFEEIYLDIDEIEHAEERDTDNDIDKVLVKISEDFRYSWLGDEGVRINKVLKGTDDNNMLDMLSAWKKYFKKVLKYPFKAKIVDSYDLVPSDSDSSLNVKEICFLDDSYGLIVSGRMGRRKFEVPLCCLEVCDKKSPNYIPVQDYCVWFANI